jgi:hypothetical protein
MRQSCKQGIDLWMLSQDSSFICKRVRKMCAKTWAVVGLHQASVLGLRCGYPWPWRNETWCFPMDPNGTPGRKVRFARERVYWDCYRTDQVYRDHGLIEEEWEYEGKIEDDMRWPWKLAVVACACLGIWGALRRPAPQAVSSDTQTVEADTGPQPPPLIRPIQKNFVPFEGCARMGARWYCVISGVSYRVGNLAHGGKVTHVDNQCVVIETSTNIVCFINGPAGTVIDVPTPHAENKQQGGFLAGLGKKSNNKG